MENEVPHIEMVIAAWIVLSLASAIFARRLVVAFLLGLLFSAAYVGYCMYYGGPAEGGGIPQAFGGALTVVGVFYLARWIRGDLRKKKDVGTTDT